LGKKPKIRHGPEEWDFAPKLNYITDRHMIESKLMKIKKKKRRRNLFTSVEILRKHDLTG
jgi:hypothetical protein